MTQIISGPGVGLQLPQNLYPSELFNAPLDLPTNEIVLSPGDTLPLAAGRDFVNPGNVGIVQILDPVTGIWRMHSSGIGQPQQIVSDGFTRRVANLTGCPVGAVVANGGSGFAQSTATITANVGGSTWQPIVGGAVSVISVAAAGANYSEAPLVFIPAPPSPGVQASGYTTIANGTVAGVTLTNVGAGYPSAPKAVILPNPTDPNFGSITQATVALGLSGSGKITAALCTYNGAPLATLSALTLTAAGGAGTGATITPAVMQTVVGASVATAGGGWTGGAYLTTVGGVPASVSAIGNPTVELTSFRPRQAQILLAANTGALTSVSAIYDGGLFVGTPLAVVGSLAGVIPTTAASVILTMGSANTSVFLQPV